MPRPFIVGALLLALVSANACGEEGTSNGSTPTDASAGTTATDASAVATEATAERTAIDAGADADAFAADVSSGGAAGGGGSAGAAGTGASGGAAGVSMIGCYPPDTWRVCGNDADCALVDIVSYGHGGCLPSQIPVNQQYQQALEAALQQGFCDGCGSCFWYYYAYTPSVPVCTAGLCAGQPWPCNTRTPSECTGGGCQLFDARPCGSDQTVSVCGLPSSGNLCGGSCSPMCATNASTGAQYMFDCSIPSDFTPCDAAVCGKAAGADADSDAQGGVDGI